MPRNVAPSGLPIVRSVSFVSPWGTVAELRRKSCVMAMPMQGFSGLETGGGREEEEQRQRQQEEEKEAPIEAKARLVLSHARNVLSVRPSHQSASIPIPTLRTPPPIPPTTAHIQSDYKPSAK